MGKKGFNWKARQVVETVIDNTSTSKIKLDFQTTGKYDQSNELVLPSEKRKTKIKQNKTQITRILSKKNRKRLEKIIDKKKKKANRASLLEALANVQAKPEELKNLSSIATIQTKGLKKYFLEQQNENNNKQKTTKNDSNLLTNEIKVNSLSGVKRKLPQIKKIRSDNPNVVGFETSESESDSSETSEKVFKLNSDSAITVEVKSEENELKEMNGDVQSNEIDNQKTNEEISSKQLNADVLSNEVENKKTNEVENKKTNEVENKETNEVGNKETNEVENKETNEVENKKTNEELRLDENKRSTVVKQLPRKPAVYVDVDRTEEIQKTRLKLPILAEEQIIMEKINENPVVILAGETGSGKTTQVPQFLYEAGYALKKQIAVTEPRRVAAITMSKRIAEEMNLTDKQISYLIRFEGNVTENTKIKFMTDGVLLKEIQNDFLLNRYSVVILDEAHERSVYTDILIGLLSRIVPLRNKRNDPLKLIVMSATLRLEDFTNNKRLFKVKPPVIKIETRQYPVTVHFNKRTNENYLNEAFNKAVKIHTKLPEGGILIFVTGQQEVKTLVRKLRRSFSLPLKTKNKRQLKTKNNQTVEMNDDSETEDGLKRVLKQRKKLKVVPKIDLDDYGLPGDEASGGETSDFDSDLDEPVDVVAHDHPLWVLPLYSLLPSYEQAKVFQPPPLAYRLCIVSTNVAETSLTIPNIKYVIDTGKTKVKLYDKVTGVSSYVVNWTSKASANQRAGRAGRLGPGHCYRLYSSAVYNDIFEEYSVPEIQQKPVDDLYLQMKCMNIDKVVNFPYPTAPDLLQLKTAENRLEILGALKETKITPLGRVIAKFPVLPRFGKMLALSHQQDLLPYTICLVAALSVQEVLLETPVTWISNEELKNIRQKWAATRLQWAGHGNSSLLGDNMVLLRAVGAAEYANYENKLEKFCEENGLRNKAVIEIRKLRLQLTNEIKTNIPDAEIIVDPKLPPPTDLQAKLLRQILLSGMGDQVAKKIMPDEITDTENKSKYKYAYKANNMEEPVFLHQNSVLKKILPEFVVYQEIYETNKMYMRGVTAIESDWLPTYVPRLCNLSQPLLDPEPRYSETTGKMYCTVTGTFGKQAWPIPQVEIEFPKTIDVYKWFAKFFLEGKIFNELKKFSSSLLSNPNVMNKSWARLQPRTEAILKALTAQEVCTKQDMEEAWLKNPKYLLAEYLLWVPESAQSEITLFWPPKK